MSYIPIKPTHSDNVVVVCSIGIRWQECTPTVPCEQLPKYDPGEAIHLHDAHATGWRLEPDSVQLIRLHTACLWNKLHWDAQGSGGFPSVQTLSSRFSVLFIYIIFIYVVAPLHPASLVWRILDRQFISWHMTNLHASSLIWLFYNLSTMLTPDCIAATDQKWTSMWMTNKYVYIKL